jgi:hypothetical protein
MRVEIGGRKRTDGCEAETELQRAIARHNRLYAEIERTHDELQGDASRPALAELLNKEPNALDDVLSCRTDKRQDVREKAEYLLAEPRNLWRLMDEHHVHRLLASLR